MTRWNPEPAAVRLWRKVEKTPTCWIWTGSITTSGHGQIREDGRLVGVHEIVWVGVNGPVLAGHLLHHECEVKRCVRPGKGHVVSMTRSDHSRLHATRETCSNGHPFDTADCRQRVCSICRRARWRAWRARQAQV